MLKDTISKKDDEIEQLQLLNTSTSKLKSNRQADHILKHSSSSPGITSLGKVSSVGGGAASDLDNFSDTSDRQSEAGSMLSIEPEVSGLGDVESDGRLSDASDGGNSTGAETDSSVSSVVDQGQEKASSAAKERLCVFPVPVSLRFNSFIYLTIQFIQNFHEVELLSWLWLLSVTCTFFPSCRTKTVS